MQHAENGIALSQLDLDTVLPYLDLHLMGATNGVRLFDAAARSWAGTPFEPVFERLRQDIHEEREYLKRMIRALGHRPNVVKMTVARLLTMVSEWNPLNPGRRQATAGAQLELEALQSLLKVKEGMWATLHALSLHSTAVAGEPVLNHSVIEQLLASSREQQQTVARVMTETASGRFLRA
ncbi:hypothetical protein AC792_07585 [Arthrobacter sp. RIT-PI-e]|uniref:hypothetical protein n=1 Tax=Arthrobacter sp. RIT-PI-e TaxID=1681197 RepID=UPI0006761F9D|nr:hypothetical protein [Arthrobacter sp. RIT-PI-e]KNC19248.1 hypothetical protein AC792_07585 [Arthrobacter sp. RIT-PI-e]